MRMVLLTLIFAGSLMAREPSFDLLIRSGRVVDGTGNPWFEADVGIRGGKIAAVGRLGGRSATRVIDARGLVVSPGFFDILHLKITDRQLWGRMPELVAKIEAARAAGLEVTANVYPYRAGQNNLSSIIPPWAHEGGTQAMLARLADPALRPRLEREILHGIPDSDWCNHYTATGSWEGTLVVSFSNPEHRRFEGKRMSEVIAALGKDPLDVLFELLQKNGGSVPTVYFHHSEEDLRFALRRPFVSIGSDGTAVKTEGPLAAGHPHPRYYGTFPRVLGPYVREAAILTPEEAIPKMTSANAAKVRVYSRGLLRPGMWADVTVLDPATIADRATYDNPHQYSVGIRCVVVNGVVVPDEGWHTGKRPGAILAGGPPPAGFE